LHEEEHLKIINNLKKDFENKKESLKNKISLFKQLSNNIKNTQEITVISTEHIAPFRPYLESHRLNQENMSINPYRINDESISEYSTNKINNFNNLNNNFARKDSESEMINHYSNYINTIHNDNSKDGDLIQSKINYEIQFEDNKKFTLNINDN
jgi:hypothetical protein